jgi:hypothetical protein
MGGEGVEVSMLCVCGGGGISAHCLDIKTCNATYNQRIIQSTPAIFSFKS